MKQDTPLQSMLLKKPLFIFWVVINILASLNLAVIYIYKDSTNTNKPEVQAENVQHAPSINTTVYPSAAKSSETNDNIAALNKCESAEICLSANGINRQNLIKNINHLNDTDRFNYVLISSNGETDMKKLDQAKSIVLTCKNQNLCIIRNNVQKGTIIKDLNRIGDGEKNIILKLSPVAKK